MSKPSIGRIVHFYDQTYSGKPEAAIIVNVLTDVLVNLRVFKDDAFVGYETSVKLIGTGDASRYWDWPPRVE